jgi:hypothetical protein
MQEDAEINNYAGKIVAFWGRTEENHERTQLG